MLVCVTIRLWTGIKKPRLLLEIFLCNLCQCSSRRAKKLTANGERSLKPLFRKRSISSKSEWDFEEVLRFSLDLRQFVNMRKNSVSSDRDFRQKRSPKDTLCLVSGVVYARPR